MARGSPMVTVTALFWTKMAFAAAVLGVGLAGALLPWVLAARVAGERLLAVGDTFAAGVLCGAGLIHLLSGGIAGFHATFPGLSYPLALLLAGAGFFLILLIEGVVVAERSPTVEVHAGHDPGGARHEVGRENAGAVRYAVILLIVLSVHSVILGLALGAQRSLAGALIVFLAIVAHKSMAGFALGVGYYREGFTRAAALPRVAFFAAMTPLGILVGAGAGLALATFGSRLFEAVFDSLGAGTFLYIATLDILKTEFDSPGYRWQKWLAALSGFAIMALLAIWI